LRAVQGEHPPVTERREAFHGLGCERCPVAGGLGGSPAQAFLLLGCECAGLG